MPSENLPPALGTNCCGKEGDQADMVTMPGPGGGSEYPVSGSVLQVWPLRLAYRSGVPGEERTKRRCPSHTVDRKDEVSFV